MTLISWIFIEVYLMIAMCVTGFCIYDDTNTHGDVQFVLATLIGVFWFPALVIGLIELVTDT